MSSDESLPEVWVSFDFFGAAFDHEDITKQLDIKPTSAHHAGDPIKGDQGRWPRDRWRITIGPQKTIEIGAMLAELLKRLVPVEHVLHRVCITNKVEPMITCAVEPVSAVTPYILFPDDVVKWAGKYDVAIAVDVLLWRESDTDD